jgi:hypothetical protein
MLSPGDAQRQAEDGCGAASYLPPAHPSPPRRTLCREEIENKRRDNVRMMQDLQRCIKKQSQYSRREDKWQQEQAALGQQHEEALAAMRRQLEGAR